MEIIKTGIRVRLTCEEEEAFIKVLNVLEKVGADRDGDAFSYKATNGTHASSLYDILNDFFQACE